MDGIESARHDLSEATCSVDTAIELLSSLKRDGSPHGNELELIVGNLIQIKSGLEESNRRLVPLMPDAPHP